MEYLTEDGTEAPELDADPWTVFLDYGRWVRTRPTEPGTYPVAARTGAPGGYRRVVMRTDGSTAEADLAPGEPGWQGWWWSLPLPTLRAVREEW